MIGAETADSVRERVLGLEEHTLFLVCDSGVELIASPTRDLAPDELEDFRPEPGGEWVVIDEAVNVVSRFADWNGQFH